MTANADGDEAALGQKRTSSFPPAMSASDPKRPYRSALRSGADTHVSSVGSQLDGL